MTIIYLLLLLALGVYSYSQIDVNLTILQTKWFFDFQWWMMRLGYFNRPLSTSILLGFIALLTVFYLYFLYKPRKVTILLVGLAVLGLFSYPAFSHDIFNYIFDARVVVFHHANPYQYTALMFPADTWTRFMDWTHRTYPYGPIFLPLTLPFYILGFNKFILTLFWFKTLMVATYLGSSYLIYRLAKSPGLVFFALNPLIIFEVLVAGHMDVVMLFFGLLAVWFLRLKKTKMAVFWLAFSAGIKYATALFLPIFIWSKISQRAQLLWLVVLAITGAILQMVSREVLPHYLIVPIGFVALMPEKKWIVWSGIILSVGLLVIRYYPFFLTGIWVPIKIGP